MSSAKCASAAETARDSETLPSGTDADLVPLFRLQHAVSGPRRSLLDGHEIAEMML